MGKNNKKNLPFVSICTPTFNRRPFLQTTIQCFCNQTYPRDRMEWIIVDDGTDCVEDVFKAANIPQVKYFRVDKKMSLGAKRNYTHTKCSGSILVYMDDDDYYPPERVSHAVETLQKNPNALCAGSSEIYVFFTHIQKMYQGGPYGPNHATAGTFAFRKELLDQTKYNENAALAEEKEFLKNYTIPFVQMDPLKTILVFSHVQNTFDKKKLLENPNQMFKESDKTVEMFIKHSYEQNIKTFFLKEIDKKLETYKHGDPIMKPDVLKQIKELEAEREKMRQNTGQVMLHRPGEEPRVLRSQELVQLIQSQQQDIKTLNEKVQELSKGPPYEELENRLRKIQMLEGLVARLREELQNAKSESASNVSSLLPSPPILSQEHNVQPISITSNVSKIIPEFAVTIPIVAV
jgi:glycosyltransferase involved in cell wall biosynthesis